MRCEHYWREGVLLVERGRPDPHRENCLDCRREHEARGELVRAFALVGAHGGDPRWQARVWKRIDGEDARPRTWVPWTTALAAAAALVVFVSTRRDGPDDPDDEVVHDVQPRIEIVPSEIARRSTSAGIGDRVRIWVRANQEARIYRAEKLIVRCAPATTSTPGCSRDGGGVKAEHTLAFPGDYQLVIAPAGEAPAGSLDGDLAAITASGGTYQLRALAVH